MNGAVVLSRRPLHLEMARKSETDPIGVDSAVLGQKLVRAPRWRPFDSVHHSVDASI
jgi:hypothetical protein